MCTLLKPDYYEIEKRVKDKTSDYKTKEDGEKGQVKPFASAQTTILIDTREEEDQE